MKRCQRWLWHGVGLAVIVGVGLLLVDGTQASAGQVEESVTFAKDVAPFLQENCQVCHRPGQIAPMSLLTYQDARPWAPRIQAQSGESRDAAVASRQDDRNPRVQERHLADGRGDRDHRPVGGCGHAAGGPGGLAAAQGVAQLRELVEVRRTVQPSAGSGDHLTGVLT